MRKLTLASFIVLLFTLAVALPAAAHSRLEGSSPAAGERLTTPPDKIVLTLSEGAEPEFSSFSVLDRSRKNYALPDHPAKIEDQQVTVWLLTPLPPGAYTVQWKVVSAVDGHLTRGSFPFRVLPPPTPPSSRGENGTPASGEELGTPAEPTAEPLTDTVPLAADEPGADDGFSAAEQSSESVQQATPLDVGVRWLAFLLAAILIGGAAFALLVQPRGVAALPEGERAVAGRRLDRRFVRVALVVGGLLLVALAAELLVQAARATESDVLAVLGKPPVIGAVLGSEFGLFFKLRFAAALAIFAILLIAFALERYSRWLWLAVMLLGGGYYVSQSRGGHAAAASQEAGAGLIQQLAPLADVVHLLATAFWIGGIFYFMFVTLPLQRQLAEAERPPLLRATMRRFSQLAIVSVVLLAVSGTVSYLAHRPTLASTFESDYGRAILLKVALLLPLLALGAYNLLNIGPALTRLRDSLGVNFTRIAAAFRRSVRLEAVLLAVVLVASAYLTLTPPAGDQPAMAAVAPTQPPPQGGRDNEGVAQMKPTATAKQPQPIASLTPVAMPTLPPAVEPPSPFTPATVTLSQTVRGLTVTLTLLHGDDDVITAQVQDDAGLVPTCDPTPAAGASCVRNLAVRLTQIDDNVTDVLLAEPTADGYAVPPAPYLNLDGNWQIVVVVRRQGVATDAQAAFRYTLADNVLAGKVGETLNVAVLTDPDPPRSGPTRLSFRLTDPEGHPVEDATVTVQGIMAAHGHLADPFNPQHMANGMYMGDCLLRMGGGWAFDLTIARPNHDPILVSTSLDVEKSDFDLTPYPTPNFSPVP